MTAALTSIPSISRFNKNTYLLFVFMVMAAFCAVLLIALPGKHAPKIQGDVLLKPLALEKFELHSANGDTFTLGNLRNHWSLVQLGFTSCPAICPVNLAQASALQSSLKSSVDNSRLPQLVFVSVDPERDTAEVLKKFAGSINPAIVAASGDDNELEKLERSLSTTHTYSDATNSGSYMVNHSAAMYVIDPQGRWVATLQPPFHLDRLQKDYRAIIDYVAQNN